jgi:chromosome segregation ATPase
MGNSVAAAPRQLLLEELRGRLTSRVVAVEKRLQGLRDEFEKLTFERIELRAELRVLEEQIKKCQWKASAS